MSMLPSLGPQRLGGQSLSRRLDALAELVRIGRVRQVQGAPGEAGAPGQKDSDGFSQELLDDAEAVLKRAGERLRLSANHTVVALAGGTGVEIVGGNHQREAAQAEMDGRGVIRPRAAARTRPQIIEQKQTRKHGNNRQDGERKPPPGMLVYFVGAAGDWGHAFSSAAVLPCRGGCASPGQMKMPNSCEA